MRRWECGEREPRGGPLRTCGPDARCAAEDRRHLRAEWEHESGRPGFHHLVVPSWTVRFAAVAASGRSSPAAASGALFGGDHPDVADDLALPRHPPGRCTCDLTGDDGLAFRCVGLETGNERPDNAASTGEQRHLGIWCNRNTPAFRWSSARAAISAVISCLVSVRAAAACGQRPGTSRSSKLAGGRTSSCLRPTHCDRRHSPRRWMVSIPPTTSSIRWRPAGISPNWTSRPRRTSGRPPRVRPSGASSTSED
jgi:hypothetical protein